jgi:hypothetical protein
MNMDSRYKELIKYNSTFNVRGVGFTSTEKLITQAL